MSVLVFPATTAARPTTPLNVLRAAGKLSADALDRATRSATEAGEAVETALTKLGLVSETDMAEAFGLALGIPVLAAAALHTETALPLRASPKFLRHSRPCRSP